MNITEISNSDRVLIQRTPKEKEVAIIKDIIDNGKVIVIDTTGEFVEISQDQIIKKY